MTDAEIREIKTRSVVARPTPVDVSLLIREIYRLRKIIEEGGMNNDVEDRDTDGRIREAG
jgi:hypothetical protein